MLTAFSFDEIDQEFVDWNLFERVRVLSISTCIEHAIKIFTLEYNAHYLSCELIRKMPFEY